MKFDITLLLHDDYEHSPTIYSPFPLGIQAFTASYDVRLAQHQAIETSIRFLEPVFCDSKKYEALKAQIFENYDFLKAELTQPYLIYDPRGMSDGEDLDTAIEDTAAAILTNFVTYFLERLEFPTWATTTRLIWTPFEHALDLSKFDF